MSRRLVLAALISLALVFAGLGVRALTPGPPDAGGEDALGAPVLSARRVPALLAATSADAGIRAALAQSVAESRLPPATQSCMIVRRNGRPVVTASPETTLVPASTLKLLTAAAALDHFDPGATFTTEVASDSGPDDGVIDGPLYLVGGGDPLLFTADYVQALERDRNISTPVEALADAVVTEGVRVVRGGVIGDHSRYDDVRAIPTWDPGYQRTGQVGPLDALVINQGFSTFVGGRVAAPDPAVHAAGVFADLLRARGVTVEGAAAAGEVPDDSDRLAAIQSPPIADLITEMLTESDNSTAELVVKEMSIDGDEVGSTAEGLGTAAAALGEAGIATDGLRMLDGSGLDRGNRATCSTIDATLVRAGPTGTLTNGLAVAGETGTLEDRLTGTPAAGRVKAKTGTLAFVSALAGWAQPASGPPSSFVVITNGAPNDAARRLEDRMAAILATLPPPPPSDVYAPGTGSS